MNPSPEMIPKDIKSIHSHTPKTLIVQKSVDRGDESDDSLAIQQFPKIQTVGKCVCSP
jgi:hypothetical protein